jgi:uncharacterized OsmC-like protein
LESFLIGICEKIKEQLNPTNFRGKRVEVDALFNFRSDARWIKGVVGKTSLGDATELQFALPNEFGGEIGYVKPEELLMSSLVTCFSAMSWRLLRKQSIEIKSYEADVIGKMDKDEEGYYRLKEAVISVKIKLNNESDKLKVLNALKLSEKYCPVGRTLRGNVELKFDISINA